MGVEIERKYLLDNDSWRGQVTASTPMHQSYFAGHGATIRVRIDSSSAWLTIKGPTRSLSRDEFEYAIPVADAEHMLANYCIQPGIEKIRHLVRHADKEWEVDEFLGANEGLIVAEVELESEHQAIEKPDWLGKEVSNDPRYRNAALLLKPYSTW